MYQILTLSIPGLYQFNYYFTSQANTARVVYSWNENDPANDDAVNGPAYHTNRGSASLNLLGGLLNMPPDPPAGTTGSFNITVDNVSINKFDLWC